MSTLSYFYYKYVVKVPILFFLLIAVGILFVIVFSTNIEVSVIETFEGCFAEDRIIINEVVDYPVGNVYVYQNRSDRVDKFEIADTEIIDGCYSVLKIKNNNSCAVFEGTVKLDVEKQKLKMLYLIFGLKKRYIEK